MIERRADDKLARTEKQNCSVGLERDVLPKSLLNRRDSTVWARYLTKVYETRGA